MKTHFYAICLPLLIFRDAVPWHSWYNPENHRCFGTIISTENNQTRPAHIWFSCFPLFHLWLSWFSYKTKSLSDQLCCRVRRYYKCFWQLVWQMKQNFVNVDIKSIFWFYFTFADFFQCQTIVFYIGALKKWKAFGLHHMRLLIPVAHICTTIRPSVYEKLPCHFALLSLFIWSRY